MEENNNTQGKGQETGTQPKTYTQEEVDALLQQEGDRRVTAALKKQESKYKEAQKLAHMDEQERFKYELEQREAAIAEKEKQLALAENKNAVSKILVEKGLSIGLADLITTVDAEETNSKIKILEEEFKKSVKEEVEKRLSSNVPKKGTGSEGGITRESFNKMTLAQQANLAKTQPELYKILTTR